LNALVVDRLQLDEVNKILKKINDAQIVSDLPAESDISMTSYDQNKVPPTKNYISVKAQRTAKETQIKTTNQSKQDRAAAISHVNDYWNSLKMSGNSKIEDVCGND